MGEGELIEELKSVFADDDATCVEAEVAMAEDPEKNNALTLLLSKA